MERTFAIVKPDAVGRQLTGRIIAQIEASGLVIVGLRRLRLTLAQAQSFYEVHKARPFYSQLCEYMCSGPVVVMVLEGEGAIGRWRQLMGATDPAKAAPGTIRQQFGQNVEQNAVHGSDAPETAAHEMSFFFAAMDLG